MTPPIIASRYYCPPPHLQILLLNDSFSCSLLGLMLVFDDLSPPNKSTYHKLAMVVQYLKDFQYFLTYTFFNMNTFVMKCIYFILYISYNQMHVLYNVCINAVSNMC